MPPRLFVHFPCVCLSVCLSCRVLYPYTLDLPRTVEAHHRGARWLATLLSATWHTPGGPSQRYASNGLGPSPGMQSIDIGCELRLCGRRGKSWKEGLEHLRILGSLLTCSRHSSPKRCGSMKQQFMVSGRWSVAKSLVLCLGGVAGCCGTEKRKHAGRRDAIMREQQ